MNENGPGSGSDPVKRLPESFRARWRSRERTYLRRFQSETRSAARLHYTNIDLRNMCAAHYDDHLPRPRFKSSAMQSAALPIATTPIAPRWPSRRL
jgi:hypothetical protein